jgi:hypothetical protein
LSEGGPTPVVGRGLLSDCRATGRAKSGCDDELKATVSERRAGVHRSFVSNHFAGQLPHANAEMKSQCIARLDGQTALSAASLRVEMETDKHHADEAQQEILSLKGRLVRALGEQIAAKHPEHGVFSATVTDLRAQIEQTTRLAQRPGLAAPRHAGGNRGGAASEPPC